MTKWHNPMIIVLDSASISRIIKARAWSVNSGMKLGTLYDQGNSNYNGLIMLPDYGYEVQAEVVGYIILGGYFVYEIIVGGVEHLYRRNSDGSWERTYR